MTLLIVGVATCLYLFVGYRAALWNVPGSLERARKTFSNMEDYVRGEVRIGFLTMLLFWPIRLPSRFAAQRIDEVVDAHDPETLARKIREQQQTIARLERELEIGY